MRISLFITCFNDTLFPEAGRATVQRFRAPWPHRRIPPSRPAVAKCTSTPATSVKRSHLVERFVRVFKMQKWWLPPRPPVSAWCATLIRWPPN